MNMELPHTPQDLDQEFAIYQQFSVFQDAQDELSHALRAYLKTPNKIHDAWIDDTNAYVRSLFLDGVEKILQASFDTIEQRADCVTSFTAQDIANRRQNLRNILRTPNLPFQYSDAHEDCLTFVGMIALQPNKMRHVGFEINNAASNIRAMDIAWAKHTAETRTIKGKVMTRVRSVLNLRRREIVGLGGKTDTGSVLAQLALKY